MKKIFLLTLLMGLFFAYPCGLFAKDSPMEEMEERFEKALKKHKISDDGLKLVKNEISTILHSKEITNAQNELVQLHKDLNDILTKETLDATKLKDIMNKISTARAVYVQSYDKFLISVVSKLSYEDRLIVAKIISKMGNHHSEKKDKKDKKNKKD